MTVAKKAAAALLCEKRETNKEALFSCEVCHACIILTAGTNPDMVVVDAEKTGESSLRLEDIQRVRERVSKSAYRGTHIFFIRDVSHMTREAANAFLKVLEEPRGNVVFFLIATTADTVLETIRSRAWHVRFWPVSEDVLIVGLRNEKGVTKEKAALAARIARGLPGRAVQVALGNINEERVHHEEYQRIISLLSGSVAERLKYADIVRENPERMRALLTGCIAVEASQVHELLQNRDSRAVAAADTCRALMQGEERFLKPYGTKRIIFEDALIALH